ncbi:MAG: 5-formyltetrahydrofolate cyclo-ligase [Micrococcus sp.]|nr:5-formyltetrahydrofolate cyclo-ligase [Micrococcus sp.]
MSDRSLGQAKAALRRRVREQRRQRPAEQRARESAAATGHLLAWLEPQLERARQSGPGPEGNTSAETTTPTIATFMSMPTEPDTEALRTALHDADVRVLVPVIEPEHQLSWVAWRPGIALSRSPLVPVDEPVGPRVPSSALDDAVALILPGLAASRDGMRLGQGGGYYDRLLARLDARVPRLVLVFADELLDAGTLPVEVTDAPVDAVVTGLGVQAASR